MLARRAPGGLTQTAPATYGRGLERPIYQYKYAKRQSALCRLSAAPDTLGGACVSVAAGHENEGYG